MTIQHGERVLALFHHHAHNMRRRLVSSNALCGIYATDPRFRRSGRGTGPNEKIGNIRFRALIRQAIAARVCSPGGSDGKTKRDVAIDVIQQVKAKGGHFLKKVDIVGGSSAGNNNFDQDQHESYYEVVDNSTSLDKTKQSFRHQLKAMMMPTNDPRKNQAVRRAAATRNPLLAKTTRLPQRPLDHQDTIASSYAAAIMPVPPRHASDASYALPFNAAGCLYRGPMQSLLSLLCSSGGCTTRQGQQGTRNTGILNAHSELAFRNEVMELLLIEQFLSATGHKRILPAQTSGIRGQLAGAGTCDHPTSSFQQLMAFLGPRGMPGSHDVCSPSAAVDLLPSASPEGMQSRGTSNSAYLGERNSRGITESNFLLALIKSILQQEMNNPR